MEFYAAACQSIPRTLSNNRLNISMVGAYGASRLIKSHKVAAEWKASF